MARIASQSKGGYYPMPLEEIELILPHLKIESEIEQGIVNLLDPCAGTGEALSVFCGSLSGISPVPVISYGVELEEGRYEKASKVLDHALHEGYESVRTEDKFSAMLLNPPYDSVFQERTETRFLRGLTNMSTNVMQKNGLLMFVIPQHVLKDVAQIVSNRFSDISVYRFTDENFPNFQQVVVFAYFRKTNITKQREVAAILRELAEVDPNEIPTLEEIDETFTIPVSPEPVTLFRAGKFNIEEIAKDLGESAVFQEFEKKISSTVNRAIMKRPILPLKSTHAGIAVASGAIGGNMGNHVVTGTTKQTLKKYPLYNDDGEAYGEKHVKYYTSVVRVFTQEGVFELE